MSICEWEGPHGPLRRFCVTHRCWAQVEGVTCPLGDAEAQVRSVLRLCGLLDGAEDPWQRAMAAAIRTALEVEQ